MLGIPKTVLIVYHEIYKDFPAFSSQIQYCFHFYQISANLSWICVCQKMSLY